MRKTFIYILKCPITNDIKYVGKTINIKKRFNCHYSPAKKKYRSHIWNWVQKIRELDKKPIIEIIEECEDNWAERERFWILYFKNKGVKLYNLTEGGEGCLGIKRSVETKKKISINNAKTKSRIVYRYTTNGIFIDSYESTTEAASLLGLKQGGISKCARCEQYTLGGYHWSYNNTFTIKPKRKYYGRRNCI